VPCIEPRFFCHPTHSHRTDHFIPAPVALSYSLYFISSDVFFSSTSTGLWHAPPFWIEPLTQEGNGGERVSHVGWSSGMLFLELVSRPRPPPPLSSFEPALRSHIHFRHQGRYVEFTPSICSSCCLSVCKYFIVSCINLFSYIYCYYCCCCWASHVAGIVGGWKEFMIV
jgi:hypothetical protein